MEKQQIQRHYLYIIQCAGIYYKIGWTSNPKERLASLRTGNPFRLRLIFSARFADPIEAEKYLHARYSEYNVRGEWFKLTHRQVRDIIDFEIAYLLENPRL